MELEQILKHIEWLDDERRKDKDILAQQEDRVAAMKEPGCRSSTDQKPKRRDRAFVCSDQPHGQL